MLEMREFGIAELETKLLAAGFREVYFLDEDLPDRGIHFDNDVSQPFVARKSPFVMDRPAVGQMIDALNSARDQARHGDELAERVRVTSQSRWMRLGRRLGRGPSLA